METTDCRVNTETRNVGGIIQSDSTKFYWLIIIGLFVANLIVALI